MDDKPAIATVHSFPLSEKAAWEIIRRLSSEDKGGVKISQHAKQRMIERQVSIVQVLNVMKRNSSRMNEGPYQAANGDWKCEIEGSAAGAVIKLALAIRTSAPLEAVIVITVITDRNVKAG
ncbi:MAG: DUF4258 domain-containing protein [Pseudomonadota bacterium]